VHGRGLSLGWPLLTVNYGSHAAGVRTGNLIRNGSSDKDYACVIRRRVATCRSFRNIFNLQLQHSYYLNRTSIGYK
jgi:hypothetical protein